MKRESGTLIKAGAVPATVNSIVLVTTLGHFLYSTGGKAVTKE